MKARIALALALCATAAFAADKRGNGLGAGDRKFVDTAARAGIAEVQAAKLAAEKGESQAVKDFARRMQDDHTKANDELSSLAKSKGAALPDEPDRRHERVMDELRNHTAARFDREYMRGQVRDHRSAVKAFEREAKDGRDADLKKWAGDKLPTLRHHLEMASAVEKGIARENPPADKQPKREGTGSMTK